MSDTATPKSLAALLDGRDLQTGHDFLVDWRHSAGSLSHRDGLRQLAEEGMAAFKDRAIVGYQKPAASSSIPDATTMAVMPFMKIRILGFRQDDIKKIRATYPYYSVVPVAAKTYDADWNKEEIMTLGVVIGCGGRSDIPEWAAYNMVKAIWENRKPQEIAFPAFKDAKPESVSSLIITPLHKGAVRYYREIGIKIPDKLIPPEMK